MASANDIKLNRRSRQLGITREELDQLMSGPCSVCGFVPESGKRSSVVGEDKPRGVLCSRCILFAGRVTDPEAIHRLASLMASESVL